MKENTPKAHHLFVALAAVWVVLLAHDFITARTHIETIPYSQFISDVATERVDSIEIGSDQISGKYKNAPKGKADEFVTLKIDDPSLAQRLIQSHVKFEGVEESAFWKGAFSWLIPLLLIMGLWWLILGRMGGAQSQLFPIGKSKARIYVERDLKTRFSDVAGVDEAKEELSELVQFLKDPSKYTRLGGHMPKGVLLVGPPGTGKTLLARAVAGEANVPFFSINGSEFVEMFVGLGAARVRDLFAQARSQAPCITFIDELDALGKARGANLLGGGANDEKEQTLNQLLAELDGFDPSQGVVLLAATNRPEVLDPALLRSGRFDRQIIVDKPDKPGRAQILAIHLSKVHHAASVSIENLASLTAGFSGADLANLVNEATLIATRRGASEVELADFTAGIERIVGGLERKSRVLSQEEKERVAFHEMGHTTTSLALDQGETVHKVSIIPRGIGALGYTMKRPVGDRYLLNRGELENKLAILLGGRAAESIFFDDISTGASDDLDHATDIARSMITRYGMSERLGMLTYDRETAPLLGGPAPRSHDYSEATARAIDQETRKLIDQAFQKAVATLRQNEPFVRDCARLLMAQETLDEETIKKSWQSFKPAKTVAHALPLTAT